MSGTTAQLLSSFLAQNTFQVGDSHSSKQVTSNRTTFQLLTYEVDKKLM